MELSQIRYFLHLADTLNFTEAARLSNVSQPSLTNSIKKLEEELGGLLIYRDGKDTRLTALGRDLLSEFTRISKIETNIHLLAENSVQGEKRTLNIGVSATVSPKPICRFINSVLKNIPTLEINLHTLNKTNGIAELLSGKYDGCFLGDKPTESAKLSAIPLFVEKFHIAYAKEHHFASKENISLEDIANEMYVDRLMCEFRSRLLNRFVDRDISIRSRFISSREDWAQEIVACGESVCFLPEFSKISSNILSRPIEDINLERTVVFASVSGSGNDKALQKMRMMINDFDWSHIDTYN